MVSANLSAPSCSSPDPNPQLRFLSSHPRVYEHLFSKSLAPRQIYCLVIQASSVILYICSCASALSPEAWLLFACDKHFPYFADQRMATEAIGSAGSGKSDELFSGGDTIGERLTSAEQVIRTSTSPQKKSRSTASSSRKRTLMATELSHYVTTASLSRSMF